MKEAQLIDKAEVYRQWHSGIGMSEIGKRLGCSRQHVQQLIGRQNHPIARISGTERGFVVETDDRAAAANAVRAALSHHGWNVQG